MKNLKDKKILYIICGGISAYKSLETIRLFKKNGAQIKTILTNSAKEFITPLSVASISQGKVYSDLFSVENETEMDHIALSRWADVILIAPATANTISKLAQGTTDDLAQALRSIGEPIFGQAVKDISGGKLLKQLFDVTEKFNMQTQPQLLMLQKTMVVVEGVARKLNPNTNIWTTSKPVLENWLRETKDPMNTITDTLNNTSEVIKRLPEFPEIMDKANQALTFLASGQIPQNSNSYTALNNKKSEMTAFRNQSIIGLLVLVIIGLLVF